MAALLIVLLIAVAVPASADVAGGEASLAPAGNSSAVKAGIGNNTAAGNASSVSSGTGVGIGSVGPGSGVGIGSVGPGSGFDSWGWNLPGGIAVGLARGNGGHGHGALWNYWSPYPGNLWP